ncbi:MAG: alanine dehydrogenase [SAR324 cluster bacterium]|nr:alanine dehydrogenase [SAR324 cluster bacterium]
MIIGVPKETKPQENRIGLTPAGAHSLTTEGHRVLVERGAGLGSGFPDEDFQAVGAEIAADAATVFRETRLILKVKEPQPSESAMLRAGQILFTFLHLAPAPQLTEALLESGATAIAYETVQLRDGTLPLLVPMSEVAGRMSIQVGAHALEKHMGGRGVLPGGIPGVRPAKVVILGGGAVGTNAAQMAVGLGADVVLLDIDAARLARLDLAFQGRLKTVISNPLVVAEELRDADLVVGAVLMAGARTPRLVTREMVRAMQSGAVFVDVAIDQGGCSETSRPTTHDQPTFIEEEVVHYCVTNMPGAVPRTSTLGLTNATLPFVLRLANSGLNALVHDSALAAGVNIHEGRICHAGVAEAMGVRPQPLPG